MFAAYTNRQDNAIVLAAAPDSERAALGIMLLDGMPEGIGQRMPPTAMHSPSHANIYRAMLHLKRSGQSIDPILAAEELRARGELDAVGGLSYIATLTDGVSRSDLDAHVARILDTARRRRMQAAVVRAADDLANGGSADHAEKILREALDGEGRSAQAETAIRAARMADVRALPVDWLWRGRIALHAITIVEGIEGVGKSTLLAALAATVTTGAALPEDDKKAPQTVLWLSAEDDLARVLKPRLEASGANCERVYAVGEPFRFDAAGVLALRELVAEHQPQLVIIDPIFAYTQGDASKGNDARALTGQLKTIAEQFECAIVLVRHIGKSKGLGDPRAAGLYSIEWRAAARSVLLVGADPDQPAKCAIAQTKNNLGPKADSLAYEIRPDSTSPSGARFYWGQVSDLTAERMLAAIGNLDDAQDKNDAVDFLKGLLADGPVEAGEIETARKKCGVSDYSLRAAKTKLRVVTKKTGNAKDGTQKWTWELPAAPNSQDVDAPLKTSKSPQGVEGNSRQRLDAKHSNKSSYIKDLAQGVDVQNTQRLDGGVNALREAEI